jgi:hypothetical protein
MIGTPQLRVENYPVMLEASYHNQAWCWFEKRFFQNDNFSTREALYMTLFSACFSKLPFFSLGLEAEAVSHYFNAQGAQIIAG